MKKIFTLAITLIATIGVCNAQTQVMQVNKTDGTVVGYDLNTVESVTFYSEGGDEGGVVDGWRSLGTATFYDRNLATSSPYYDVEVQQNASDHTQYRLVHPYLELVKRIYGVDASGYDEYFTFRIVSVGERLNGVTVTQSDLVYYEPYDIGYYNSYLGTRIIVEHPSDYRSPYSTSQSYWLYNNVVSYQSDGETPSVIQLAPVYAMPGYGSDAAMNYCGYPDTVLITFP